ncbi:response regulator [Myxosarcina sp. GI1]|uniref:response regulator n=1 Tax=Myxosarcina sp. GI1 TaxID=1541065 RepID=UPI00056CCB42|nr:response regulator [Myxosarcina sp. GI1]
MNKRVLIVDDEPEILFVLQRVFEDFAGWKAVTASSGKEGLAKARTEKLDSIILDVSMPEMDGFQFVERLQLDPQTEAIPVVLLTAKVTPGDRAKFAQMKIAGSIAKPFDPTTVWTQVAALLGWTS